MLRRIFVAIGVSVMVLGGVLSAQADDQGNVKQHQQILNAVNAVQAAVDALSAGAPPPCGAGTAGQRFVVSQDSTEVCDNTTGVVWQREPLNQDVDWLAAISLCQSLGDGYRLPEFKEMLSLVDFEQFDPALPPGHPFVNVQLAAYWSATAYAASTTSKWYVHIADGFSNRDAQGTGNAVWCVRGAM